MNIRTLTYNTIQIRAYDSIIGPFMQRFNVKLEPHLREISRKTAFSFRLGILPLNETIKNYEY